MFTVALIGADGAGKTTVGQELISAQPLPLKYIYMGVSPISSNVALPTTRLISAVKRMLGKGADISGPPDPTRAKPRAKSPVKRLVSEVKSGLKLSNRLAEEWFRQIVVWSYQRRGYVVLFDRHFFSDYYAHDIAGAKRDRSLSSRLHGYILQNFYPKPDLLIFLDAPAEVLWARKGEGTLELLEYRRQEYLQLRDVVKHFVVVDASQPAEMVVQQVSKVLQEFHQTQNSQVPQLQDV